MTKMRTTILMILHTGMCRVFGSCTTVGVSILKVLCSYRITSGAYQYGRTRPGVGDRLLDTWDVHGVLEDFCKAMEMTLPTGDDVYVTAKGQFDWIKEELSIPEVS